MRLGGLGLGGNPAPASLPVPTLLRACKGSVELIERPSVGGNGVLHGGKLIHYTKHYTKIQLYYTKYKYYTKYTTR